MRSVDTTRGNRRRRISGKTMTTLQRQQKPIPARCPKCGKLLGKIVLHDGSSAALEAYCKRCNEFVTVGVAKPAA